MESVSPPKRRLCYSYESQHFGKKSIFLPLVVVSNFKALQRADSKQLSSRRSFKSLHCYLRINLYSRVFHHSIHNSILELPLTNSLCRVTSWSGLYPVVTTLLASEYNSSSCTGDYLEVEGNAFPSNIDYYTYCNITYREVENIGTAKLRLLLENVLL